MKNICILRHEQKEIFSEVIWKACFEFIIYLVYMTTEFVSFLKSSVILDEVVEWPIWSIIASERKNYKIIKSFFEIFNKKVFEISPIS